MNNRKKPKRAANAVARKNTECAAALNPNVNAWMVGAEKPAHGLVSGFWFVGCVRQIEPPLNQRKGIAPLCRARAGRLHRLARPMRRARNQTPFRTRFARQGTCWFFGIGEDWRGQKAH